MLRLTEDEIKNQVNRLLVEITDGTWGGIAKGTTIECKVSEFYENWISQQGENLKAQLKKVVVVLDLVGNEENVNNEDIFVIPAKLWQALLKEVGE